MNNALKATSKTDDEIRVSNYIVLFGGRDLEGIGSDRKNEDGSIGEYFTPDTELESSYTKAGILYVDWEHGIGKHLDGDEAPDEDEILGFVDWKTAKKDERGVWVERILKRRNEYMQWLEELIDEGMIGTSSEAIPGKVEKSKDGAIKRWPLRRDTLTVQPMEPRMMTENVIAALKHIPGLVDLIPDGAPIDDASEEVSEPDMKSQVLESSQEGLEMSEELEQEVVEEQPQEEPMQLDADELLGAIKSMIEESIDAKIEALKSEPPQTQKAAKKPALFNINPNYGHGDPDIDADFRRWVVTGESKVKEHKSIVDYPYSVFHLTPNGVIRETKTYKAALQEGTTTEGGYLVPVGELGRIIAKRDELALAGPWGCQIFTTDMDTFNIPTEGTSMTAFTIVAEEGAITAAQNEPTFAQVQLTPYKYTKLIKVSDELSEDENSGLDAFLAEALGRAWAITENAFIQTGTGSSQPQGAYVGGTAGLTLDSASAIGAGEIPELIGKLQRPYRDNAILVMRRAVEAYLLGLFGTSGFSFVQPPVAGMFRGQSNALSAMTGYPVWATEDSAAIAASAKTLLFGNFNFYAIARNRSLRVRRLVELYAGNGQIGILATMRTDGKVLQAEAFQYATHPSA